MLDKIDWEKYNRQGLKQGMKSPDISELIRTLSSQDYLTRMNAWSELRQQLEWAYEKRKNDLPYDIAPLFIELLQSGELPDRGLITDLLLFLLSYSEFENLQEPYRSEALRLKECVCQGIEVYRTLLEDEELKEDIILLVETCEGKPSTP